MPEADLAKISSKSRSSSISQLRRRPHQQAAQDHPSDSSYEDLTQHARKRILHLFRVQEVHHPAQLLAHLFKLLMLLGIACC